MNDDRPSVFKEIVLPLISAVIAIVSVVSGYVLSGWAERSQTALKVFEITFPEKQKGYARLMRLLGESFYSAAWQNSENHYRFIHDLETSYFVLEPFLPDATKRAVWAGIQKFMEFCEQVRWRNPTTDMEIEEALQEFAIHRDNIRASLFSELFSKRSPYVTK